jgi:hypothetical protein
MVTTSCRKSSSVQSSPTESRSSDRMLKLPPDPFRHQNSAMLVVSSRCRRSNSAGATAYRQAQVRRRAPGSGHIADTTINLERSSRGRSRIILILFVILARPERFELPTPRFVV